MVRNRKSDFDYSFIRKMLTARAIALNIAMTLCVLLIIDYLSYIFRLKDSVYIDVVQTVGGTHLVTLVSIFVIANCARRLNTIKRISKKCITALYAVVAIHLYYLGFVDQTVYDPVEQFLHFDDNIICGYTLGTNTSIAIIVLALSQLGYAIKWRLGYLFGEVSWILPTLSAFSYVYYQFGAAGHMSIFTTLALIALATVNIIQYVRKPHLRNIMLDRPSRTLVINQTIIVLTYTLALGLVLAYSFPRTAEILVYFSTAIIWGAVKINISFGDKYSKERRSVIKAQQTLHLLATRDYLTGALSRRGLDDFFGVHHERSYGVILMDLDRFKSINDTYGHDTGDIVLKKFAHIVNDSIRKTDAFVRWGGEEFLVILPASDVKSTLNVAETIRKNIETITANDESIPSVTSSFGVAVYKREEESLANTISVADKALYKSKQTGRNKITLGDNLETNV